MTKTTHGRVVTLTLSVLVGVVVSVGIQVGDEYRARREKNRLLEMVGLTFVYPGMTAVTYPLLVVSHAKEPEAESRYPGDVRRHGPRFPAVSQWIVGALAFAATIGTPVLFFGSLFRRYQRWFFVACGSMALGLSLSPLWVLGVVGPSFGN